MSSDEDGGVPLSQQRLPKTPIGWNINPGQAQEGTVLATIESAIQKHIIDHPEEEDDRLEILEERISAFEVVRNQQRPVCHKYISRCIRKYERLHSHAASASGRTSHSSNSQLPPLRNLSTSASTSNSRGSHAAPTKSSSTSLAPSSTRDTSTILQLNDETDTIAIVLANNIEKPVSFATHPRSSSYITPRIVQRIGEDVSRSTVIIQLRFVRIIIGDNSRARSYGFPGCSFKVKDGLATDIAIGRELWDRIGSTKIPDDSFDADSSTEDPAPTFKGRKAASAMRQPQKPSSSVGSSSAPITVTSAEFTSTVNRLLDREESSNSVGARRLKSPRHELRTPSKFLDGSQPRKPRDSGYDSYW